MDDQLVSFLRSFLCELEEDELLEDEEEERRFFDLLLCFFTFLHYPFHTFSSSHSRRTTRKRMMTLTGFSVSVF